MKPAEKTALYRELAKLTQADFHLDRSIHLLASQKGPESRRVWLEGVQKGLTQGMNLTESVRTLPAGSVSSLDMALIEAGERSGRLSISFNHLARYYASVDAAARQMRGALIYPLILLHLAIVLPEIPTAIMAGEGSGFMPRILLWIALLWVVLALLWQLWRWLERQALKSPAVDRLLGRVPWIGKARRHWALARFFQVFHAGLLAALRISEICRLAGEASQSGSLRAGAELAARRVEQEGEALSLALADSDAFDSLFINSLATAEEVGKLDEEMLRWGMAESLSAGEAMEAASRWLPKAGYFLVAGFVAYRIITMVLGYYGGILRQMEAL